MAACDETVARAIPVITLGIIIYGCYAVTKPLCIDYLIHPLADYNRDARVALGAVIITLFYALLLCVLATYLRLYCVVVRNPDSLPCGEQALEPNEGGGSSAQDRKHYRRQRRHGTAREKTEDISTDIEDSRDLGSGQNAFSLDDLGLEKFYLKDVFVCQQDGRPPYCSTCCQFKTDRAHHSHQLDRCSRKLDHFCPWVGGVIAESSFKFFLQFVCYTTILCAYDVIVFSIFAAELDQKRNRLNSHWIVSLGLGGLFFLFSAGMSAISLRLAMLNVTTIENLTSGANIWSLAILIPPSIAANLNTEGGMTPKFPTVSYSLSPASASSNTQSRDSGGERIFAILQTDQNPFDLGSPLLNLQQVMGYTACDWLLPIKLSPCTDHSSPESIYALGPVVQRLKREAGLEVSTWSDRECSADGSRRSRPRRRKSHVPSLRSPERESRRHRRSRSATSTEDSARSNRSNVDNSDTRESQAAHAMDITLN
ncbi:DHHC palmitoyltransferase domain containing protein [Elaphomyces granulatus]